MLLAAAGAAALAASGAGGGNAGPSYTVVFDNAFGLTPGVDLKIGGVRAGSVDSLDVERKTGRALVEVKITQPGFSRFRSDVKCAIRPQSLIGEYFVDCQPGTKGRELRDGGRVAVEQTETTIPPDIVQDILRRPYRERLALIFNEFGGALAARGPDLNETIRRAVPALRETDRTLAVLAANRAELQSLTRNSAAVLEQLADRREDVARFVAEARDAASASADRRSDLALTVRRFPGFLAELRPTLADLGTAAREQTPALTDLGESADDLTSFLNRLGPFTESATPAIDSLGEASKAGRTAARAARPTVAELRELTRKSPELATNLAVTLEHLADRKNAVEKAPWSPGGQGFTGLEAILQYPFVQSQAINIFDKRGYILKLNALVNECTQYTNAKTARDKADRTQRCSQALGPTQPGITSPDPTGAREASTARRESARKVKTRRRNRSRDRDRGRSRDRGRRSPDRPAAPATPGATPTPAPTPGSPLDTLDDLLPKVDTPGLPLPRGQATPETDQGLLDFLLGP